MGSNIESIVSVRNLVEFILRSGDIDNTTAHADTDAMQEGARIHRKLQKAAPVGYRAEVPLKTVIVLERGEDSIALTVDGRADGILTEEKNGIQSITIDEIKSTYLSLERIEAPVPVHEAQAKCYAAIYGSDEGLTDITVQLTYCNIDTEQVKQFATAYTVKELKDWFDSVVNAYSVWLFWELDWKRKRDASIKELTFPYSYRPGQRELVGNVYKSISRGRKLFIEAPTGVGKTISTVFPAVWTVGEGKASKIFYLTAKTIARTVAEDTFSLLSANGLKFRFVTITSREKSCVLEKPQCNPKECPRAKGHFDRVNDCVFDLLQNEENIDREKIFFYAEKHNVCPFEMCLDVSTWADGIICDYNYAFDPRASLKRYFSEDVKNDYIFLIDEAHNLLERSREMYSAELVKEDLLMAKRVLTGRSKKLERHLDACNKALLAMKRECEDFQVWDNADDLYNKITRLNTVFQEFLEENTLDMPERDEVLDLYFSLRTFAEVYEKVDETYRIYTDYLPGGDFRIKLMCMEPAAQLKQRLDNTKASVLFSATLLPMDYYKEQLGGNADDYAIYAPSPFKPEKRLVMVGGDVSTKYTRRGEEEYSRIADYIDGFTSVKTGNYMVFFSSYKMLEDVTSVWQPSDGRRVVAQRRDMTEKEKEEFLAEFACEPTDTLIGMCVMGGIFSEGIDLKGDRLTGAVIVGPGLPMVGYEKELFKYYFDDKNGKGFEYAYLYPGMNKVMQSAGRVIRTVDDVGAILLLDDRFLKRRYNELFPHEWFPFETVTAATVRNKLKGFFDGLR
jgi:Rad3-related DNA helicase